MLRTIGFDRVLTQASGAWYDDADGNRYLDFLSGFGVLRHRPQPPGRAAGAARRARRRAGGHGAVRPAAAARPARRGADRPLPRDGPGLLLQQRHRGSRGGAEVRPLRDRQRPDPLLRPRLPRADRRLAVGERRRGVPRGLRRRCCRTPASRSATSTRSSASCAAATSRRCSSSRSRARASTSRRRAISPPPSGCCTSTGRCSSSTRCRPGSVGPVGSTPTSTTTSARTSSRSRRRCPAASCRSARRWPGAASSRRSTPRSTGCSCMRRPSPGTRSR